MDLYHHYMLITQKGPMCPQHIQAVYTQKLFITPNRDTHPIDLNLPPRSQNNPLFDHFSLPALFSHKILTDQEFNQFKSNGGQEIVQPQTFNREGDESSNGKKSRIKQKGIRNLSKKVYQIVLNLQSTSYAQVVNKLIEEFNQAQRTDNLQYMTEKNIKRRVYDVLSVLLALGLLRKEGKQIMIRGSLKKRLAGQLVQRSKKLQTKEKYLVRQGRKLDLLPLLIESNIQRPDDKGKIMMPFMILGDQPSAIHPQVDGKGNCRKIEIRKKKSTTIKMDLDCLPSFKP